VLHTIRLFGEQVIPHFKAKEPRPPVSSRSTYSANAALRA
jgi:hypothetical protein